MKQIRMDMPIKVAPNTSNAKYVTYRDFWIIHTMYFLNVSGVLNNKYAVIDYYILEHFDLIHNKLELTNQQLLNQINDYLAVHSSNPIGIHSISRAIDKMKNITMLANGKSFISKVRSGISGKQSYLQLNPAILPDANKLNDYIWMSYKSTSPKDIKYNFIVNTLKQLHASEISVLKKLLRIHKKESKFQTILDNYR